jgi:hypothetical protein
MEEAKEIVRLNKGSKIRIIALRFTNDRSTWRCP